MIRRRDARPAAGLALAVLLHLLALGLLRWQGGAAPREGPAVTQQPLSVRLLWPAPPPRAAAAPAAPAHPAARPRATSRSVHEPSIGPGAITAPAERGTSPEPAAISAAAAPAPPTSAPLLLSLPARPASAPRPTREQALNDPRANTRMGYSERFAATLGTNLSERVTTLNGGRRIRQGSSCHEVMDSRASQLDPNGPKWPGAVKGCD